MLKLSQRLLALARLVPTGMSMADIGTDHGLLPCYLIKKGISPWAVGVEFHAGPYLSACRTVEEYGLGNKVVIRRGDGFQPLQPGEVDAAVIAGMGGSTMKDILADSPAVVSRLKKIILQPMNGSDVIRVWLHKNGWKIMTEDLILEDQRLYEIMAAEPGTGQELGETEACYGPVLIKNRHPLLRERLQKDEIAMQEILANLAKSESEDAHKKIEEYKRKLGLIKELEAWLCTARRL